MKTVTHFVVSGFVGLSLLVCVLAEAQPAEEKCRELYQEWHRILKGNPIITEPLYFTTNSPIKDLSDVVNKIHANRTALGLFLSKKMASETTYHDADIDLLDYVAGINLWFPEHPHNNIAPEITTNLARFREEWGAGVYEDPSKEVIQFVEKIRSQEDNENINPRHLAFIRRYGMYALPELTRQIRKHNSKHAFGAYLVASGQRHEYREYLENSQRAFTTVQAKLDHVRKRLEGMKTEVGAEVDLIKRMAAALAE
jgi:hypothetical protein